MTESRDSPQRRKQFLIICAIMAGVLINTICLSGILFPVEITEGIYPGGEYVYKFLVKDYAASAGTNVLITEDLSIPEDEQADLLYSVFIDDMTEISEGNGRFMAGLLTDKNSDKSIKMRSALLEKNPKIEKKIEKLKKKKELNDLRHPENILYESGELPSVVAAVAHFPFTNGFVSALMFSYKVLPTMQKWAREHIDEGSPVVVSSTCSIKQQMCTHYVPLFKADEFLLGRPDTKAHKLELQKSKKPLSSSSILKGLRKLVPF